MNERENLISLLRRQGYSKVPREFILCPSLEEEYKSNTGSLTSYGEYFQFPWRDVNDMKLCCDNLENFKKYYNFELKPGTTIDTWGVGHEPGSEAAKHMTYMRHPLQNAQNIEDIKSYPYPDFKNASNEHQKQEAALIHEKGLAAVGNMQCTVWERAWYLRSMPELMVDMMSDDPKAECILDIVTELSCIRAESYASAGVDILFLGDDIGMQNTILMSDELYRIWIKPRLKKVIDAAKAVNPDILIFYHSCGYVEPLIPHLIEAGIDVLNPVQPECMDFKKIHTLYGDRLSFHGTLGTQTLMPFGTPEEVRKEVFKNMELVGDKGGLFIAPTHMLEPEVPWENIKAYMQACDDFVR